MKTVNVAELEGVALDYAVLLTQMPEACKNDVMKNGFPYWVAVQLKSGASPSTDWSQGGPLIESLEFGLAKGSDESWVAIRDMDHFEIISEYPSGPAPLIATCRAIVAAKFGDTVEVPEELL